MSKTVLGDAAHRLYPRGSNGAAQALIDARTLADILSEPRSQSDNYKKIAGFAVESMR